MDIDRGIVAALLREGMVEYHKHEITPDMLDGTGKAAFVFVDDYWRQNSKLPDLETIKDQTGITFHDVPKEPLRFWSHEIRRRHLYNSMQEIMSEVLTPMEKADSFVALEKFREGFFKLGTVFKGEAGAELMFSDIEDLIEDHDRATMGLTGIASPYPTLNEATQGWQNEDLVVIAGRPGQGKTLLMILMAVHAWRLKKRVMFVSTEMSKLAIKRRFAGVITKTSYTKIKKGRLTEFEMQNFKTQLLDIKNDANLIMMGSKMNVTLEMIESQALVHKPDIICIDGFYLLRSALVSAKSKFDRVSEVLDLTKAMTKRLQVPVILTTQMNRANEKGKGGGKPDLDRLAFSDNMGMIADYVFFLDSTDEMRAAKEMRVSPIKTRESEKFGNVIINWDFETQDFSEKRVEDSNAKKNNPIKAEVKNLPYKDDGNNPFDTGVGSDPGGFNEPPLNSPHGPW